MFPSFSAAVPSVARLLYTHNPFYLLGTLLLIAGIQQSLGREPDVATSGLLVVLVAGYALLLAAVAVLVIRVGQVWDDARTILLVIVLLFFMLSTSLDFHLLFTLEAPWPGTWLLTAGLAFSVLLSEGLLSVLRIRLPLRYRGPYYLMLLLLFGYPVALGWLNYHSYYHLLGWALLAFPALAAVILLTLWPAARVPAHREGKTGTPWIWPYYPWSLFVFLTVGVAIRAWWLTIAFEPAKGADAYFRPYFLLPLVLAWAILVLEMGLTRRNNGAIAAGLSLPLIGLFIGFPGAGQSAVEVDFLNRLVATVGSPPQLAVGGLLLFYAWAWSRRVRASEEFLIALGLLFSVVGRETLDWSSLQAPRPLVVAVIATALLVQAVRLDSTWRAIAGGAIVSAGIWVTAQQLGAGNLWFWQWHAPLAALLAVPAIFNDRLAKELREVAWRAAPAAALAAATVYPWTMPQLDPAALFGYLALVLLVSGALWLRMRQTLPLGGVLATLAANVIAQTEYGYVLLAQTPLGGGRAWLASGAILVLTAVGISLLKMGMWPRAWRWLERLNLTFRGAGCGPP
jgi:hypothetical protein